MTIVNEQLLDHIVRTTCRRYGSNEEAGGHASLVKDREASPEKADRTLKIASRQRALLRFSVI